MEFKPTVITYIILASIVILCSVFLHGPAWAYFGGTIPVWIGGYYLGKFSVIYDTEEARLYRKTLAEANQIEEIALSSSISLFPEIQEELVQMAIVKYISIGHQKEADNIRGTMAGKLI